VSEDGNKLPTAVDSNGFPENLLFWTASFFNADKVINDGSDPLKLLCPNSIDWVVPGNRFEASEPLQLLKEREIFCNFGKLDSPSNSNLPDKKFPLKSRRFKVEGSHALTPMWLKFPVILQLDISNSSKWLKEVKLRFLVDMVSVLFARMIDVMYLVELNSSQVTPLQLLQGSVRANWVEASHCQFKVDPDAKLE
jgi:hypothetical protein